MTSWSVDPDGVLGVLAGLDADGPALENAVRAVDDMWLDGDAAMRADGRSVLANAWGDFLSQRRFVPGELIRVVTGAAAAVGAATVAVVVGDDEMAGDTRAAAVHALDAWGIDDPNAYRAAGV